MAEGMIGGILGNEDEKPEVEAKESLAAAEAFAAAVASRLSANDPEVAKRTAVFLEEQAHLLRVQRSHLEEEHALRLIHLRGQTREGQLRRTGMRLRLGFQVLVAVVASALALGGFLLVRDAVTSRQVVVDPFHVPPGLAARGIDGTVIASGLLDELGRLQDATRASSAARGLSGAWTHDVKLEVPETGLSLGEISRLLRERFGHDIHIDGDIVEAASTGGVALTVRGDGVPARIFIGPSIEVEKLCVQAAEYIYSRSQPGRWATYLIEAGRPKEALEFVPYAIPSASPEERPVLLNVWGYAIEGTGGSEREALEKYRAAVKLRPDLWQARNDIMNGLIMLGDEENAWRAGEEMRKIAGGRPGRAPEILYENWDILTWNLGAILDAALVDQQSNVAGGTGLISRGPQIADIYWRLHDPAGAQFAINTTKEDPNDPSVQAIEHFVRGRLSADTGDAASAAAEMRAFGAAVANPYVISNYPGYNCWIAPAEEAAGNRSNADAILKASGTFVDCYRFRADILDGRGDWAGSQKAYAKAVALAPDLPAAYYSWGVALARHGDLAGAVAKLELANQRGPHWADPLKAWGDVLVRQRNTKDALVKYDEALKYAPNWKQLKDARDALAKQKV
jgi:tetratricopeptide (TPR) repeat protein